MAEQNGPVSREDPAGDSLSVVDHLELALEAARDEGMSTGELMGLFFYYAHTIAESTRQEAIAGSG